MAVLQELTQFIPRDQLSQLDPAIVSIKLSTKWQEEILERELITMLAPIHVENSGQLWIARLHVRAFTAMNRSDPSRCNWSGSIQEAQVKV